MPDGSKRLFATAGIASEARSKYRFLPSAALPPDLPDGPVPIADMANAFGVTHRTLHFYEEKGLISANRIGLMRVYGQDDVMRMAVITVCRETGMPIAVIQELMDELRNADSQETAEAMFREALQVRKRELTAEMSTLHRQLQQVGDLLDFDGSVEAPPLNDNQDSASLTAQERRCLELMAEGYSTQRIARALDLKHDETRDLEAGIILKFRANNRFQAIAKAVLLGIVQA
ncbi:MULTISPECIES: MerR family transcriptional regulator [Rhizobium]|jgi:DNA-binding transcriptional MerR regulator|uniref:MerR family transcriptional regulator n=1 Tax=Rhizobium leguminosarum bv. viciae TaxID=387 RepID=A0A8G2J4I3_RHILV|nr:MULTISPECIES: MerR family transcriptional regulator [Rhizobium]MBY3035586.1 MerR family transcriptional regulator [Rhizobium laguerreae]MBY3084553.1 MerR family transcriptional regulator [Rhizobium laguerreae]MBY3145414.1 MerR family transcriptional regulator [Rhizobium laguerreae]MBY3200159.1 MerR family transcriptional regulator [Rhizobium laguerreae]MBY3221470.1 MerR family transcriptional regulator [Rhizobium laguerreae]